MGSHGGRLLTIETQVLPDLAMRLAEAAQQGQELRARVAALEMAHKNTQGVLSNLQVQMNAMQAKGEEFSIAQEKKQQRFFQQVQGHMGAMEKHIVTQINQLGQEMANRLEQEMISKMEQRVISKMEPEMKALVDHVKALAIHAKPRTPEPPSVTVPPLVLPHAPTQAQVATGSGPAVSLGIPKIDRSKKRGGGAGLGGLNLLATQIRNVGSSGDPGAAISQVQARLAPVQAGHPVLNVVPQALAGHLLGVEPRKFSGERADWPEWRWQWLQYHELVTEAVPTLTARQTLSLLKHYLDSATADELDAELFKNPHLEYEDFWVKVDLEFGGDSGESKRAQWTTLRLKHDGRLKLRDWRNFSQKFLKLMKMVPDAQEDEAARLMWRAVPMEFKTRIAADADKKNRDKVLVMEGLPVSLTEAQVSEFLLVETGTRPSSVRKDHMRFNVHGVDEAHRREIMKLDRQPLEGGGQLAVRLLEMKLRVRDIDDFMCRWLRVDEVARGQDHESHRQKEDRPRFQREVQAVDSWAEDGPEHQVAQITEKSSPKSSEMHPKKADVRKDEKEKGKQDDGRKGAWGDAPAHGKGGKGGDLGMYGGGWPYWTPGGEWWPPAHSYWPPTWSPPEKGSGKGKGEAPWAGKGAGGKADGKNNNTEGGKAKGKGGRGKPGEQGAGGGH